MTSRKLVLYSDQNANPHLDKRVLALIGRPSPSIGYIASTPDPARIYFEDRQAFYKALGANLTIYVDSEMPVMGQAWIELFKCDAIHLSGGNTFGFLNWLKQKDLLSKLAQYVDNGGVLIGVSAGAILMTPNAKAATLCGDVLEIDLPDDTAMNLVDFHFWPHFDPGHVSLHQIQLAASLPNLYSCPDSAGIVVDGNEIEVYGSIERR